MKEYLPVLLEAFNMDDNPVDVLCAFISAWATVNRTDMLSILIRRRLGVKEQDNIRSALYLLLTRIKTDSSFKNKAYDATIMAIDRNWVRDALIEAAKMNAAEKLKQAIELLAKFKSTTALQILLDDLDKVIKSQQVKSLFPPYAQQYPPQQVLKTKSLQKEVQTQIEPSGYKPFEAKIQSSQISFNKEVQSLQQSKQAESSFDLEEITEIIENKETHPQVETEDILPLPQSSTVNLEEIKSLVDEITLETTTESISPSELEHSDKLVHFEESKQEQEMQITTKIQQSHPPETIPRTESIEPKKEIKTLYKEESHKAKMRAKITSIIEQQLGSIQPPMKTETSIKISEPLPSKVVKERLEKPIQAEKMEPTKVTISITVKDIGKVDAHKDKISVLRWNTDGNILASASYDRTVVIWDANKMKRKKVFKGHHGRVLAIGWSPNSEYLASGDEFGKMIIWNVIKKKKVIMLEPHKNKINDIEWFPSGKFIITGGKDRKIIIYNFEKNEIFKEIKVNQPVISLSIASDESYIAAAIADNVIKIIDTQTFLERTTYTVKKPIKKIEISPSGRYIAVGAKNGYLFIVDRFKGKVIELQKHKGEIASVSWSPDEKYLITGGMDAYIKILTVGNWEIIYSQKFKDWIRDLAWNPKRNMISIGLWNNKIMFLEVVA